MYLGVNLLAAPQWASLPNDDNRRRAERVCGLVTLVEQVSQVLDYCDVEQGPWAENENVAVL